MVGNPFIGIRVEGEKQLAAGFVNVQKGLSDFREPLIKANSLIRKAIDVNFEREGSELGRAWKPLAKKTPPGRKILQKTGNMRNSFRSNIMNSNTRVVIRNTASYFPFHQSKKPRFKLPRRIMMRIDKKRRDEVTRIFTVFLDKVAKRF